MEGEEGVNSKPSTLNPKPSTLNPQPSTLNPQPSTLNPQPATPNDSAGRGTKLRTKLLKWGVATPLEVCGLDAPADVIVATGCEANTDYSVILILEFIVIL